MSDSDTRLSAGPSASGDGDRSPTASPRDSPSRDGSPAHPTRDSTTTPRDRRHGLSCAECRRSKLKCDRTVPCSACIRRGCAALCPNGVMPATKGNKALQNHAQKLGEQVTTMSVKIKELETALAAAHIRLRATSEEPGEHESRDPSAQGTVRQRSYGDGTGTIAIDRTGVSSYFGDTAASEHLLELIPSGGGSRGYFHFSPNLSELGLPSDVVQLYNAFPFGIRDRPYNMEILAPYLPPRERALELIDFYFSRYVWIAVGREEFMTDIIDRLYRYTNIPRTEGLHPHQLALFFIVMAIGALRSFQSGLSEMAAIRYYVLACSAISLVPLISEAMCATVQALVTINSFLFSNSRVSSEEMWLLVALAARTGYRIGLHRDGAQFKLNSAEIQRRRHTFWELYSWDAWLSLVTGRPPTINLSDTDTKFPEILEDSGLENFLAWRFRYAAACLWPCIRLADAQSTSYEAILALDRKIRTFPIPTRFQTYVPGVESRPWPNDTATAMQEYCIISMREMSILTLHRNYVAVALSSDHANPLAHQFGGSVLAAYRAALRLTIALKDLYRVHPQLVRHIWYFWSGVFSALIIMAAIPIMCPGCSFARAALLEFKSTSALYIESAKQCGHPSTTSILQRLEKRAEKAFKSYWTDPANHSCTPIGPGEVDELRVLGGLQCVIEHPSREGPLGAVTMSDHANVQPQLNMHQSALNADQFASNIRPWPQQDGVLPSMALHSDGDMFDFSGLDNPFPMTQTGDNNIPSILPTYEQIMMGSTSVFPVPISGHPLPQNARPDTHGQSQMAVDPFNNLFPRNMPMTQNGADGFGENIWSSFIGGLVGNSGGTPPPLF